MVVQATGRVVRDRRGLDLIVERRIPAPTSEVWKWLTAPSQLKKWIGTYKGTWPAFLRASVNFVVNLPLPATGSRREEGSATAKRTGSFLEI